ncbi:MAG TPA: L,D-transpeptidase family protein [Sphingomicrobium sp.]|nr:L,D-transpeptidase family protein [Sphingomicrobium sp.]
MTTLRNLGAARRSTPGFGKAARIAALLPLAAATLSIAHSAPAAAQRDPAPRAVPGIGNDIAAFYRSRGGAPLWFSPTAGPAPHQLLQLLSTAAADNMNPNRYRVRQLAKAVQAAATRRNPAAVQRAEVMLSEAFVTYARDLRRDPNVGIIYVDPELRPVPPSPRSLLDQAAASGSISKYIERMGWMSPVYAQLRRALAARMYRSELERQLLVVNLERARALPSGNHRYAVVNPAAQRLYMYEDGQVVDMMRVIAGKPAPPIAQTPMMSALIRFVVLNPYWNAPPDITAQKLAPNVLKQGRSYLKAKGYQVMSDWTDGARVLDPGTVDWKAVVAGRVPIRLRQLPGPANSMGRMKFMFPNEQGIWLHDTPQKELLDEAARLQSNGCVRLQDAPRFARWLFGRPLKAQGTKPEQSVPLPVPVPVYITYLTAVPSGSSIVYFDDVYGLDRRDRRLASR